MTLSANNPGRRSPPPPQLDFPSPPSRTFTSASPLSPPRPRSHPALLLRPTQNPASTAPKSHLQSSTAVPQSCRRAVPCRTLPSPPTPQTLQPSPPHNPPASPPSPFPFCLAATLLPPPGRQSRTLILEPRAHRCREVAEIRV